MMNTQTYGLTRKQCGVIFANIKNGNLNLPETFSKFMYNEIAEARWYAGNNDANTWMASMRAGLDAIFANDYEEANERLTSAMLVWNSRHIDSVKYAM